MRKAKPEPDMVARTIFTAALLVPVITFFVLGGFWAYDVRTWYLAGQTAYENGLLSVYAMQAQVPADFPGGYFNYPIPWLAWTYTAYALKQAASLNLTQWIYLVKLPELLFTLGTAVLVHYWSMSKFDARKASLAVFAFTTFPGFANILFGPVIGYFDPIPVFFSVLAFVLFEKKKAGWSALALGVGAAFKYYPLLLLPVFLFAMKRKNEWPRFAAICVTPLVLVSIPPLLYDYNSYIQAHLFYANWAGSTSFYRMLYDSLGWDRHLWFGKPLPGGVDLSLLPLVSIFATVVLGAAMLVGYATAYVKRIGLLESIVLLLVGILGFWRFAEHNHALWVFPFTVFLALGSKKRVAIVLFAWGLAVFFMSLPYIITVPAAFEAVSALLVPVLSILTYLMILWMAWFK